MTFPSPQEVADSYYQVHLRQGIDYLAEQVLLTFRSKIGPVYRLGGTGAFLPEAAAETRRAIFNVIRDRLHDAGWYASMSDNQRDGNIITIRPVDYDQDAVR